MANGFRQEQPPAGETIREREAWHRRTSMREIIFGFNDGTVSTLALLAGVVGGALTKGQVTVAGLSGVVGGSISMAIGAYISSKSENEVATAEVERERQEIEEHPTEEREEVRDILAEKGPFTDVELGVLVDRIASDSDAFLDVLVQNELGVNQAERINPYREGLVMGAAFVAGGLVPIIPFMLVANTLAGLVAASLVTFGSLFGIGIWKSSFTLRSWLASGIEMVLVGLLAAIIPYLIGDLFINRILGQHF